MPAVCPIAWKRGRCRCVRCRLRHDIVQCGPCRCYVLHDGLARHRRGEDHRRNCNFTEGEAQADSTTCAISPLPYPRIRNSPPRRHERRKAKRIPADKRAERSSKEEDMDFSYYLRSIFTTGRRPEKSEDELEIVFLKQDDLVVRSTVGRHRNQSLQRTGGKPKISEEQRMVISGENSLTLKSTASWGRTFPIVTAPIVIDKLTRNDGLILVDVELTGVESTWYVVNTLDEIG